MSEAEVNRTVGSPSWRGPIALGFVAISLVTLVALPAYQARALAETQDRVSRVLEPARARAGELLPLFERQRALVLGFIPSEDRVQFREPYMALVPVKEGIMRDLGDLARDREIQPGARDEFFDRVAQLDAVALRWDFDHNRYFEVDERNPIPESAVADTEARHAALVAETEALLGAIDSAIEAGRRDIEQARTLQNRLTAGLGVLALMGLLIISRVGYRYRALTVEREQRRREAVRARREIDALLEATGDGVLGIDLDGRCTSLNRAGVALLGYSEREMTGRDVHDTIFHSKPDGSERPRDESVVLAALRAGEPLDSEEGAVLWARRGVALPSRWSLRPLLDGAELRGAVLTFTDMTAIRANEEALRRAVRQREDVVSIVSHDLRNPLGVALAAADLLLDLPLDEQKRRRQAEIIARSGRRMKTLIDDLLDVSRIEAGAFVVRPSLEPLGEMAEEAFALFHDQASAKGVRLRVVGADSGARARVDRDRVLQALANLLDNALRVTDAGGTVTIDVAENVESVLVAVEDTGPGVPPELVETLFDRFAQSTGRSRGGAGLGLAIVRGIAQAHEGSVAVEEGESGGARFVLAFPKSGPPTGEFTVLPTNGGSPTEG